MMATVNAAVLLPPAEEPDACGVAPLVGAVDESPPAAVRTNTGAG